MRERISGWFAALCYLRTFLSYFCTMSRFFRTITYGLLLSSIIHVTATAQSENGWTLQRSVQYALEHNLTIQQNVLNARLAKLTLQQSQLSQLPNVNTTGVAGRSFGRSVDPTTNQFVEGASYDFMTLSGNVDILVFGWFQKRYQISQNKFSLKAAHEDVEQIRNDISLNVATGYLRALLAAEQVKINKKQVELSEEQLKQTQSFAEAGRVPELNVAQMEAQVASDSSALISSIADMNSAILDIKALLNLNFETPYELAPPQIDIESSIDLDAMDPEQIYHVATQHFGSIKGSEYRLIAAEKGFSAAKSALWPRLGMGAQFGTNWASTLKEVAGYTVTGARPNGNFVPVLDTTLAVYQPTVDYQFRDVSLRKQLDNNFRQTVSFNLSIPIFNGFQAQTSVKQARINMLNQDLNKRQAEQKLKQDVYKAYFDAKNAVQKYHAAKRAKESAQRAYDYAEKRYELGLSNTVEYLTTQNTLSKANGNFAIAKYDLIFKLKVIDYYLGKELKL